MSKRESFARYILIIKKLKQNPCNFEQIENHLINQTELQGYNYTISKRTFQRDIQDISSLFDIEIEYDYSRKIYFILDENTTELNNRLLEAFDTFNALNLNIGFAQYIHFETRKPIGTEHLHGILHAIKNRFIIEFTYHKHWEEQPSQRIVEPYALKEFKNRWYVLAKDSNDSKIKSFALDRISFLQILLKKFKYPNDFNVEEMYKNSFGIISPNGEQPKEIILSFDAFQGKYIKTMPLHHSQQILIDNKSKLQIKLNLCISHDLIMELLQYGDMVEIIKPKTLANQIKKEHEKAFNLY